MRLIFLMLIAAISLFLVFDKQAEASTCRSSTVKHQFDKLNGYPHGRPSLPGEGKWIVDHWCALECGGIDSTSNMVYQQFKDSKAKDRWERTPEGCAKTCTPFNSTPKRMVFNCK